MPSSLYRCTILHRRLSPKRHRFRHACFLFHLDLDELPELERRLPLFSHNRRNLYSLRDSDHLDEGKRSIRENLVAWLRNEGVETPIGKIHLLTNLRTFGHIFNPVSFYFVHDRDGNFLACVAEVANTFNEQKLYLVDGPNADGTLHDTQQKLFYISPFSALDTQLVFKLKCPGERLRLSVNERDAEGTFFISLLAGHRVALTTARLLGYTLRFPFITLGIVWSIHWQALRLWMKGVPLRKKGENPNLQRRVRRYLPKPTRST